MNVAITDFLTDDEIRHALGHWRTLRSTGGFARLIAEEIIQPALPRINATLGQENDAQYLAYVVEYVFAESDRRGGA